MITDIAFSESSSEKVLQSNVLHSKLSHSILPPGILLILSPARAHISSVLTLSKSHTESHHNLIVAQPGSSCCQLPRRLEAALSLFLMLAQNIKTRKCDFNLPISQLSHANKLGSVSFPFLFQNRQQSISVWEYQKCLVFSYFLWKTR